jgi:glycosyltransferase involved in cell wall biosynthesis
MELFEIIFFIFVVSFAVQIIYYWGIFSRLAFYKKRSEVRGQKSDLQLRPVSVVIAAKNEYENLQENLPLILEQDYPDFEVVLVNDCSDDDTDYLLKVLSEKYDRLKVVNIVNNVNFFSGKKFPLSMGIKSAKNDILLLTDADCRPASNKWIYEMQSNYGGNTSVVLGYGTYAVKKGLINKLIRYDTFRIAIEFFSYALSGFPYMGVGRNLSYTKTLFYENKGFTSHYTIRSGDDDLFINKVANKKNTRIEISHGSHTVSEPKPNFSSWMKQKKRHLSTGMHYRFKHKLLLGLFSLSRFLFLASFTVLVIFSYEIFIVIGLLTFRLSSQLIINKLCINKLNERNLLLLSPVFELLLMFLNFFFWFSNLIFKSDKWK